MVPRTTTSGARTIEGGVSERAPISVEQYLNQPGGFRIGLFGKHDGSGDDEVQVDAFNVVAGSADPQTPGDHCGGTTQCPHNDEFEGTALDEKWEVVNPTPSELSVGGGNLTLTTAQGDVFGANFTAHNILMQEVPEGTWTVTTKLDHTAIDPILAADARGFAATVDGAGMTVCGRAPIIVFLAARVGRFETTLASYYTSIDVTGDCEYSVSYAAIVFRQT